MYRDPMYMSYRYPTQWSLVLLKLANTLGHTRWSLVLLKQTVLQAFDAEDFIQLCEDIQGPYHRTILDVVHYRLSRGS